MHVAVARTQIAVNAASGFRFPPESFVKLFRLLEDLQLFHGSSSQSILYARGGARGGSANLR
jgi:hypothetical protein